MEVIKPKLKAGLPSKLVQVVQGFVQFRLFRALSKKF